MRGGDPAIPMRPREEVTIVRTAFLGPLRSYVCRACGYVTTNQGAFKRCPVCGIKWG